VEPVVDAAHPRHGLIGFIWLIFANKGAHASHAHGALHPPATAVVTLASRVRATILCSRTSDYKHYLKVLGDRAVEGLDLSAVRFHFQRRRAIGGVVR